MTGRRRPMRRLGDLLPAAAAEFGLEEELRLARAMSSWARLVGELAPPAAGASRLLAIQPGVLVVSADAPIVAQELRLRSSELLAAFATAPGGARMLELRVVVGHRDGGSTGRGGYPHGPGGSGAGPTRRVD
jgi:predicted nucleic acid-binding Zn ribbon protein